MSPRYDGPVIWVKDASRSVPVAAALLSDEQRPGLLADVRADYDAIRTRHAAKAGDRPLISLDAARANATPVDWAAYKPLRPHLLLQQARDVSAAAPGGPATRATQFTRVFRDYPVSELRDYIDWQPFFAAWELKGKFPDLLNNPASGETARKLYADAQAMLDRIESERWLRPAGVIGLFPANSVGDDIEVYAAESRTEVRAVLHHLRQQGAHRDGIPNRSNADFVAPKSSGVRDYMGAFAVTAGVDLPERVAAFKAALDDYSAILLESLADRLAEAFAERLHERVRREFWGYHPDERLGNESLRAVAQARAIPALAVDALKLPHHGSQANVIGELIVAAPARHYLVSSNGDTFGHPDDIAIARVVTGAPGGATVWFNYRNPRTERWADAALAARYGYAVRYPTQPDTGVLVRLPVRS